MEGISSNQCLRRALCGAGPCNEDAGRHLRRSTSKEQLVRREISPDLLRPDVLCREGGLALDAFGQASADEQQADHQRGDDHKCGGGAVTERKSSDSEPNHHGDDPQDDSRGERSWCSPRFCPDPCAAEGDQEGQRRANGTHGIGGFTVVATSDDDEQHDADHIENEPQRGDAACRCHVRRSAQTSS